MSFLACLKCVILCQLVALFGQIVELFCLKTVWSFETVVFYCGNLVLTCKSTALFYQTAMLFCQNTVFKCLNIVLLCKTTVLICQRTLLSCLFISNFRSILPKWGVDWAKSCLIMINCMLFCQKKRFRLVKTQSYKVKKLRYLVGMW
jgi:hypothetical protein